MAATGVLRDAFFMSCCAVWLTAFTVDTPSDGRLFLCDEELDCEGFSEEVLGGMIITSSSLELKLSVGFI